MKKIFKLVAVLMIITMAVTSLNLSAFAAHVDTREQEAVRVLKEVYSKMDSQQQEKYVMLLERASSEGNTELLKNHKKYIDKKYKPTGKKLSDREYDVANKIVSAASYEYALNFSAIGLPWALRSTLYAIGAALNLSWVPTAGQIVAIIVGVGAIAVFIIYREELMDNFKAIVREFKRVYSNMASSIVSAFNDIKARVGSEAPSVSVTGKTITVDGTRYRCTTLAEEAVDEMQKKRIKYYPAVLADGAVWVAPVSIDRKEALAIMRLNSKKAGVFAITDSMARGLCSSLGRVEGPDNHGAGSGYWYHYHGTQVRNAHCWFIF